MSDNIERRFIPAEGLELRAEGDESAPKLRGVAIVYDRLSQDLGGFKERIAPGAVAKALGRSDVRALFNHDANLILGRSKGKNPTLRLEDSPEGLRYEVDLPNTSAGRDVLESVKRGDVDGSSFAFTVGEGGDEWSVEGKTQIRTITEFQEIFDVSPVVFPAYKSARVSARALEHVRSATEADAVIPPPAPDVDVVATEHQRLKDQLSVVEATL